MKRMILILTCISLLSAGNMSFSEVNNNGIQTEKEEKSKYSLLFESDFPYSYGEDLKDGIFQCEYDYVNVMINGKNVKLENKPVIRDKKVLLLPVNDFVKVLGGKVKYTKNDVTITYKNKVIILVPGDEYATIDGKAISMDTQAQLVKGVLMVPGRFIMEALECDAETDIDEGRFFIYMESKDNKTKNICSLDEAKNILKNGLKSTVKVQYNTYGKDDSALRKRFYFFNLTGDDKSDQAVVDKYTKKAYYVAPYGCFALSTEIVKPVKIASITEAKAEDIILKKIEPIITKNKKMALIDNYGIIVINNKKYCEFSIAYTGAQGPKFICNCYVDMTSGEVLMTKTQFGSDLIKFDLKKFMNYFNNATY